MFAVIALFDNNTEVNIRNIWSKLRDQSISAYAFEVENRKPHLTLASYSSLDLDEFIKEVDHFYDNKATIPISYQSIGTFLSTGILYLAPTMTEELFTLHRSHHQHFSLFSDSDSLYAPGQWIPHCTIANRLSNKQLLAAYSYCVQQSKIKGRIEAISVIEILDNGKVNTIFTKELR